MISRSIAAVGLIPIFMASTAMADVIWDEDIDGSLSTDRFNTTDFGTLSVGSNNMIADTVSGISKFFTFTIAEGNTFSSLILDQWISEEHKQGMLWSRFKGLPFIRARACGSVAIQY